MRTVHVTRYITPLREGGSLPAVVEADDDGLYVLKFRGAGQGPRALVAELVAGELARALGLPMPEIVLAELDPVLAETEPDPEIQELIRASSGTNLALDYLPGAFAFDPAAHAGAVDADLASRVVWFDAFVSNLDRTPRNTNLLVWHRRLHLIDHGAALYFHHAGGAFAAKAHDRFPLIAQHVLLPRATRIDAVDHALASALTPALIDEVLALLPSEWLLREPGSGGTSDDCSPGDAAAHATAMRRAYAAYFAARLAAPRGFVEEALKKLMNNGLDSLRYDYAVLRAVPRVERGEFMNVGIVVWCPPARLLALQHACDAARLLALDPLLDLPTLHGTLEALSHHCSAAAGGSVQALRQTFDFLVATRSAVLQISPVHTGITRDVQRLPQALMDRFVHPPLT